MSRALLVAAMVLLPLAAAAETIGSVTAQGNGTYRVEIDGRGHVALTESDYHQLVTALAENVALKKSLAAATDKLAQYQSLTDDYESMRQHYLVLTGEYRDLSDNALRLNADYATAADRLLTLNHDYSQLVRDYDSLTEKYRNVALRSRPREMFDIGLGAVASDNRTSGILMVGTGAELLKVNLRGWLFGGPDNYGVIIGSSF